MDDCLISKRPRKSQHTLANIISFKGVDQQIIDEILCMDSFHEGDLELFDRVACENGLKCAIESIFECFLKIAGIEPALLKLLDDHSIYEKLANVLCKAPAPGGSASVPSNPYTCKERPFEKFRMFGVAKNMLSGSFDDSKVHILAYLICIDKNTCYKGEYEVFYIIDYFIKSHPAVQTESGAGPSETIQDSTRGQYDRAGQILLGWAENCSVPFSSKLLLFDPAGFFESETLYLRNFELLCKVITARRSHKILLSRLCFIVNSFSSESDGTKVSKKGGIVSLSDLLVASYSGESKGTNEILLSLSNEALTKDFIIRTGASLPSFFEICRRIDPLYIKCMNICIDHFGIAHGSAYGVSWLQEICGSEYFRIDSFQGFQRVVRVLKENGVEIPVGRLCSSWGRKASNEQVSAMAGNLRVSRGDNDGKSSLRHPRDGKKEVIDRVMYLLQESIPVPLRVLKKCITKKYPRLSAIVMLKSGSFKLFKYGYAKLKDVDASKDLGGQDEQLDSSKTNEATLGHKTFGQIIVEELQGLDYSRFYQRVVTFLLDRRVLESHPPLSNPSPLALALLSKLGTGSVGVSRPEEELAEGLYFYKSSLKLSNLYKKFVFGCRVIVYKECLMDMPIIRFGEDMSVDVCCDNIVCNSRGDQKIVAQLKDCYMSLDGRVPSNRCYVPDDRASSKHLLSGSFGMVYGSEMGAGRFSVADIRGIGVLSEQLEIRISVVLERGFLSISLNEKAALRLPIREVPFIEISTKFYGVLKSLLYAETNEMGPPPIAMGAWAPSMDVLYDKYINPIEKLLRYKNRKGVFIDTLRPFYLSSSSGFLHMNNVIEYRSAGDVEFYD